MSEKRIKQSVLVGALTSSFGIFISKALGLLYLTPLNALAGESNMSFYSITYTYYDLLLKISSAGIPFAIAALVARYYAKEDYKTVLLVKKLGVSIIMALSFLSALFLLIMANPLARQSMGRMASPEDLNNLRNLFYILLLAIIFVPYLSALRGYYQGLKRLDLYASSQVLEQIIRVGVILLCGYILVRILKLDNIYAIYSAIAAAGIGAIISLLFLMKSTNEDDHHINELIDKQESEALSRRLILKEILFLGIPYVLMSVFGSASPLVNTTYFLDHATRNGMPMLEAKLSLGILQTNCSKLASIPQVLTLGFSSGLVPYLTESLETQNIEKLTKQICQLIETVLFILIPVLFIYVAFSKDIYFIMYGNRNLELGNNIFKAYNLVTFTDTLAPIFSSIMITLRMHKHTLIVLVIAFFVKLLSFFPLVSYVGTYGMIISSALCSLFSIILYLFILNKSFGIKYKSTFNRILKTIIASIIMIIPTYLIHYFINPNYDNRLLSLIIMAGLGLIMLIIYYFASTLLKLPQEIFEIEDISIKKLLKRFRT